MRLKPEKTTHSIFHFFTRLFIPIEKSGKRLVISAIVLYLLKMVYCVCYPNTPVMLSRGKKSML